MKKNEIKVELEFKRYYRVHKLMDYVMLLSIAIVAVTTLIVLPYTDEQRELMRERAINENLRTQLSFLEREATILPRPSDMEIAYSDAYDYLVEKEEDVSHYIYDILDSQVDGVRITNIQFNDVNRTVRVVMTTSSDVAADEFIVAVYETFGVSHSDDDPARWITRPPERRNISATVIEVVFHYA